jgi:hypothetical protein
MANLTLAPNPWFTGFDDEGAIVPGGLLFTYAAGTSDKLATYTDVAGLVANTNPIVLDAAGRVPSGFYLLPRSYKFILAPANDTDPPTNPIRTQDNIGSVPNTNIDNDVLITAGEALLATEVAYLSDGSGGLTAGRWYKADADLVYASTTPEIAVVVADIALGEQGTGRLSGRMTGMSGLVAGTKYYVSATAGALTSTVLPNSRFVGQAESLSVLVISANPPLSSVVATMVDPKIKTLNNGRLSLTTGVPVTTADVTGASAVTLFWVPYQGNEIALYSGSLWVVFAQAQLSIAVPATTNQMYDAFMDYNAGVPTLIVTSWTNDTTRAAALTTQDGVLVKSGTLTSRYLGSFRTTGVAGQTEDSFAKRFVWNYDNRVMTDLRVVTTSTWNYTLDTWRQANASTVNQLAFVNGVSEDMLAVTLAAASSTDQASLISRSISLGLDSTTAPATGAGIGATQSATGDGFSAMLSSYVFAPAVGYHFVAWLEKSDASGTTSWFGTIGTAFQGSFNAVWKR